MRIAKILMLGDIGVGKTSIARRLVFDQFDATYKATIGTDIYRYEVVPSPIEGPFHFVVWDTDGNFGDTIFQHVYARRADAAMVVGDATRNTSLEAALQRAQGFMTAFPGRPVSVIVNKIDLLDAGVQPELPQAIRDLDIPIILTSAKTGHHVRDAFQDAATVIARRG
jgi:Ras-related protein Rab-5C